MVVGNGVDGNEIQQQSKQGSSSFAINSHETADRGTKSEARTCRVSWGKRMDPRMKLRRTRHTFRCIYL